MRPVAIVTDSCASLPAQILQELNIHWVAYYIHRGQEILRDLVTIQRDEFLSWLATAKALPTTACPGPGDYFAIYQQLAEEGTTDIVSLHMTSTGSGAYQSAKVAQEMAEKKLYGLRIEVIDTHTVSLCQGWMVIEAARAALAGKTLDEIVVQVKQMIPLTQMMQTADTLKYLYMGGRIGLSQHLVGSLLNIKPLIGIRDGVVVPLGVARSRLKAYQMMVEMMENAVGKSKIKIAYVHAGALAEVEKIKQMVEERVGVAEWFFAELSPALMVYKLY